MLFIVLDTSRLFHDKDSASQIDFVKKTLSQNKKKWVVAVAHHPYISNGKHGNAGSYDGVPFPPYSGSVIKNLVETELCGKVNVFIGGHDHSLQTLLGQKKCAGTLFVVSGGGASTDEKLKEKNPSLFQKAILGFTSLKFKSDHIEVRQHDTNGNTLHSYNYKKLSPAQRWLARWTGFHHE